MIPLLPKCNGNIFIISAPSGTGKTTLVSRLTEQHSNIRVSVSYTTRPPRTGEQHCRDYHFIDIAEFKNLIKQNFFLEYAEVFGHYYGTGINNVRQLREQGYDVILEINVQGAQQIRQSLPDSCSIFILPPSLETLHGRLIKRNTDDADTIAKRLKEAQHEIRHAFSFDYVVVNKHLSEAEADLLAIIQSHRLKQSAQRQLIENLLSA